MKRILCAIVSLLILTSPALALEPLRDDQIEISAPSAVLMERSTGQILYEKNAFEHLSPASVTKVMTMLLVAEAVDDGSVALDDPVTASARAASMGGSQIWLEEGETMSVGEMLKCVAVVSANDCCVALAEHLSGTESAFVARMNDRAAALGMADTHFTCCSGLLEGPDHYSCAYDIALMSRELLKHDCIRSYTTIWMDTIRDGAFTLSNTNKLIYHYEGATGLKTGFTSKAMYCLSASAMRDGVEYIAVVLHAPSSSDRFESAKTLLSYAFANYTLAEPLDRDALPPVGVALGEYNSVQPILTEGASFLLERSKASQVRCEVELPESVSAPVAEGQVLGTLRVYAGDEPLAALPLVAEDAVARLSLWQIFCRLVAALTGDA